MVEAEGDEDAAQLEEAPELVSSPRGESRALPSDEVISMIEDGDVEDAAIEDSIIEDVMAEDLTVEDLAVDDLVDEDIVAEIVEMRLTPSRVSAARSDTASEFKRLYIQWRATDDAGLREQLILMHRSLVIYLARRFADRGESMDDIVQQGMIGLIYALDHFDPSRGVRFATFATPTIIGEIRRYFRDKSRGVRIPRRVQEMNQTILSKIESLTQEYNRSPTYREIAQALGLPIEDVIEALESGRAFDPISLDEPFTGEDAVPLAERIGEIDPALAFSDEQSLLHAALLRLPKKHRVVLHHAYFENKSQVEIARLLNASQMHVSRLLRTALAQLRKHLEEGDL